MEEPTIRVLVVDDYEPWRRFLRSTLAQQPRLQLVGEAADGLEAVQSAVELQPDLILLDIGIPKLGGIEAARRIREQVPRAVILFLTQESSADVAEEALRLGLGYVTKVNAAELLPAVEEVLRGRQFVSSGVARRPLTTQPDPQETKNESTLEESQGTYRVDMDSPLPVNLPEEEQIERILRGTFIADCNDALAKMYGLSSASDLIGKRMAEMVVPEDAKNIELTRKFIRSGYRVLHRKSYEVDIWGNPKVFLNSMTGVVIDGRLVATWGRQSDITNE